MSATARSAYQLATMTRIAPMRRSCRSFGMMRARGTTETTMRCRIGIVLLLAAGAAHADQYSYVSAQQAAQALQTIADDAVVHAFCAPCNESRSRPVRVRQVEIGRVWEGDSAQPYRAGDGQTYWQVYVNGESVDLAYLYVRAGESWENLALQMGLPAQDVPRQLAPAQTGN